LGWIEAVYITNTNRTASFIVVKKNGQQKVGNKKAPSFLTRLLNIKALGLG